MVSRSMVRILLVSHSPKLADGLAEMIRQMASDESAVQIVPVGGTSEGELGTDPLRILSEYQRTGEGDSCLVFADIGSSIMSASAALDMVEDEALRSRIRLVDAPLVEGAFAAGVVATTTSDPEEIVAQALDSREQRKFE